MTVDRAATGRTLILYLGGDRSEVWKLVASARARGAVTVASFASELADDRDLEVLPTSVRVRHVGEMAADHGVAFSREAAWRWLEEVALRHPTALGPSLFDLLRDDEGRPLWWLADITLQERTFLAVRFVNVLDALIREEQPTFVAVAGTDAHHPWQRPTARAWSRARRIRLVTLPEVVTPGQRVPDVRPARARWPVPPVHRGRADRPRVVAPVAPPPPALDLLLRVAELVLLPFVAVVLAVVIAGTAVISGGSVRRAPAAGQSIIGFLRRVTVRVVGLLIALVLLVPAFAAAVVIGIAWIVTAERADALPRGAEIRAVLGRLDPRSLRRAAAEDTTRPSTRGHRVLFVEDVGNRRWALTLRGRRRIRFNPYFEGIVDAMRAVPRGPAVTVVTYGSAQRTRFGRIVDRVREVIGAEHPTVAAELTPHLRSTAERWALDHRETAAAVLTRGGLGAIFTYQGVPLLGALRDDLETMFAVLHERRMYAAAFRSLIRKTAPDLVIAYNWEGVFRPLTHAAVAEGVPLLGVQQALGPYGHALDHGTVGYVVPGSRGEGFPAPSALALWGDAHAETIRHYGYPPGRLPVVGYPRLDPFVRAQAHRRELRRRLHIPDGSRIVLFTAVLRVIGTGLVRERNYLRAFDDLVELARSAGDISVIVKPWPGDDLHRLEEIVWARGDRHVRYVSPDIDLHNADLLAGSDVLVGTFSSIIGEAVVAGCEPILLDVPEARYYFGEEHVRLYDGLAHTITSAEEVRGAVEAELAMAVDDKAARRADRLGTLARVFGPIDGHSAERVARLAAEMATEQRGEVVELAGVTR